MSRKQDWIAPAAERVVSLPMLPELTDAEADRVIEAVRAFFG